MTYTLNDWFGARVTAAGTGVLLNNEMDDFTAKSGVPNCTAWCRVTPTRSSPASGR